MSDLRRCDACTAEVASESRRLTEFGQFLCQSCYGQYLSLRASAVQRKQEVHRRCGSCGSTLFPAADVERIKQQGPRLSIDADGDSFDDVRVDLPAWGAKRPDAPRPVMYVGDKYVCTRCGVSFRTHSTLLRLVLLGTLIGLGWGVYVTYSEGRLQDQMIILLMLVPVAAMLGWDLFLRVRHVRVE